MVESTGILVITSAILDNLKTSFIRVIYCDEAYIKNKSDILCTFKFTGLYKTHVYLLKFRGERV